MKKIDDFAYGEVKALMDVGEGNYVDSGILALDPKKPESLVPVILMLKKPGEILTKSNEFVTAEPQQKLTMKTQTVRFTCAKFVDLVFNKHIVHGDNNGDNILVEFWPSKNVKSVELVDWGFPGARYVNVKKLGKVARSDVYQWCTENFVW
ncbi:hypothetical protein BT96DRAFT_918877 [Gymnopus androsaceus JB14]|uniref:Protein kinase domain-containing protein n=1 Tax=Gymnopus androsaceus JB14 TaxID=1447944 RepID=A0A6A4HXF6_9AGAR|nr:hypothetical protein BT96DRAFT_918877 [Gymnopus androsaceus JB14]